jgi:signal transduction histidine kinase
MVSSEGNIWRKLSLRFRIYTLLATLMFITISGGLVMIWYTHRMEGLLRHIIDRNVAAFQMAEALENSLVNQKGFVSYYFLDGNPEWLRQLGEYRQIFRDRLDKVRSLLETDEEKGYLDLIESENILYVTQKDRVIALYRAGEQEEGLRLHKKVREHFSRILDLCKKFKDLHTRKIAQVRGETHIQAKKLRMIAATAVMGALMMALLLVFVLVRQILAPLRRLTIEVDRGTPEKASANEVKALSQSVYGLIEDRDHAHSELEKSREHLLQAEKMALVGRLAAGVAHSIRNPLTSVKMRLFSLSRALTLSATQQEDFQVISEEIRHIDTIVQNFLEFSRPPKLKIQKVSPSDVVDGVVQLLQHRLKSYDVEMKIHRQRPLPAIMADPEQLKEALVNLVVNACESMTNGGLVRINEEVGYVEPLGKVAVLRLSDSGPGVPESIRERIFEPFYTTKEEGTGLGLSIVSRIVEEHGGWLDLTSKEGEGSTFVITLPLKDSDREQHPDH